MQVKRFVAPSMRIALKMVREELGDDAVILSNKRVAEGIELLISVDDPVLADTAPETTGIDVLRESIEAVKTDSEQSRQQKESPNKLQLEIERIQQEARQRAEALAASMSEQAAEQPMAQASPLDEYQTTGVTPKVDEPFSTSAATSSNEEISQLRTELQSMRDLMEMQYANIAWGQFSQQSPQQASIWRRMKRMGLMPQVVDRFLTELEITQSAAGNWQRAMKIFSQSLPVTEDNIVLQGGIFALVGPTGVGKSITMAKLAASYVLEHGAEGVALVTTDSHRLGAYEQLRTVARILGVPVKTVDKQHSLDQVLYSLRHKDLVLIDTAGLNHSNPELKDQLNTLSELGGRVKTLLVLAATAQAQVLHAAYDHYQADNLAGCIITKLDETLSMGEVLSLVIEKQLPMVYTTNGQEIPNDLALADRADLVRLSIQLAREVKLDEQVMADELAERRKFVQKTLSKSLSAG